MGIYLSDGHIGKIRLDNTYRRVKLFLYHALLFYHPVQFLDKGVKITHSHIIFITIINTFDIIYCIYKHHRYIQGQFSLTEYFCQRLTIICHKIIKTVRCVQPHLIYNQQHFVFVLLIICNVYEIIENDIVKKLTGNDIYYQIT